MDYEDFKNLTQGIQAIFFSLAIIVGGMWTVFKLIRSKELDKSRSEALKLRREIERKKGLEGNIKISIGRQLENNYIPVFIEVQIENKSTETHTLDWNKFPLKITEVEIVESNGLSNYVLNPITKLPQIFILPHGDNFYYQENTSVTLLPEAKGLMKFLWNCPSEGIYFASISAPLPDSITKYLHQSDKENRITLLKTKYENELATYEHRFCFSTSTFFQVLNNRDKTNLNQNEKNSA